MFTINSILLLMLRSLNVPRNDSVIILFILTQGNALTTCIVTKVTLTMHTLTDKSNCGFDHNLSHAGTIFVFLQNI